MALLCPCDKNCKKKRSFAINTVIEKGICTGVDLRALLLKIGGEHSAQKSLKFLSSGDCTLVGVFVSVTDQKPMQFRNRGRLFYRRTLSVNELYSNIIGFLPTLQKKILEKFTKTNKRIYYFSKYDLRKMHPYQGVGIDYALERLIKLGFLEKMTFGSTEFYVGASRAFQLENQKQIVIIDDKVEYAVIKIVHELIMNLYPANWVTDYSDRVRPQTRENLILTGGMTFDIFYPFCETIAGREYLAIDVYTRIPVNGYTVNSFMKKIEWAKKKSKNGPVNHLNHNTYGMIIYRNATKKAILLANKLGIRFLRLKDIKIDYTKIHKEFEDQINNEQNQIIDEQIKQFMAQFDQK